MNPSFPSEIQSLFVDFFANNAAQMVPLERSQRTAFEALWPQLLELRKKGFSFAQISQILEKCGLHLATATVEIFYEEMLYQSIDALQSKMSSSIIAALGEEEFLRLLVEPSAAVAR